MAPPALRLEQLHSGSPGGADVKIGMSVSTLNNPYFVQLRDGAQAEAKKAGVDLTVTDAQNDASQQANQVQNFASQDMKAIILNPVDSDAAGARGQGGATRRHPGHRGRPRRQRRRGRAHRRLRQRRRAASWRPRSSPSSLGGKGTVVVLQGTAGTSAARDRGQGFTEGIKAFPGIQVVAQQPADFDRTKGLDVMTNLLQSHPGINGVFAENDEMALGAIKALGDKAGK